MCTIRPFLSFILHKPRLLTPLIPSVIKTRSSSYQSSPFLVDVDITTKYEKTQDPEEWKYVERVLPSLLVPKPKKLEEYKSEWKAPGEDFSDKLYYIPRTRNHMMPVFLRIRQRGQLRSTLIKHIQGDIWALEKDLRLYLEDLIKPYPLRLQVDEFSGKILIHGDHVNAVKYWLAERNF